MRGVDLFKELRLSTEQIYTKVNSKLAVNVWVYIFLLDLS